MALFARESASLTLQTLARLVLRPMTPEGSDGEKFEVSAVVRAVLEETRHSVTLHPAVKKTSLTYILGFAMGEDAEEVKASMPAEPAEWKEPTGNFVNKRAL